MVKGEWQMARKFIYATLKAVEKFTERLRISEHIFDGTVVNDLLFASGCFAESGLQGPMNFSGTYEPTQEKRNSLANSAESDLCEATICQSM
jgi:hypothetical protein